MLRELGLVNAETGSLNDLLNGNNSLTEDAREIISSSNMHARSLNGEGNGDITDV